MEFKDWLRAQWDRVAAGVALGTGALALLLGWLGVRDAVYPGQQIPYIVSGGLLALFLVGVGAVLWLSADLRDEWRKLDDIDDKLGQLVARGGHDAPRTGDLGQLWRQVNVQQAAEGPTGHRAPAEANDNAARRGRRRPLQPTS